MIKPERSKRSLRFLNSCWHFLTHLKSKNKNKPELEAEVENVCGSKENIHGGQGEPLQQEVTELPVCDESFGPCDETVVSIEEVVIADECDTVNKESSPEPVVEVEKDYVLQAETLKKSESSSSDDQFFYQPVSKRREVIEKRILSLKGDVPNVERIFKNAEDEIKNRHNDLAKWEEKDRQLIAPHPSEDCLTNPSKEEPHNVEETPAKTTTALEETSNNDKSENNSLIESSFKSNEVIGEEGQNVVSEKVNSSNEESGQVENLVQPSVSTEYAGDTNLKTLESTKLTDFHGPIAEPRKCISESLVNKANVDRGNDSSQSIPFPDVIENALENTEYMDEELQESGLEMNQFENNLDDISDGAQSQTYFSEEISTTPVTEKSFDGQSTSVQPLGRFAGLGDHNFEQMINNSFTIFSVLEDRMCDHSSEIVTSDENVEILPTESDINANTVWEGDLTAPSVPMFHYGQEHEEFPNEVAKNNTPEPLEQYFEFNSSHTSFQQELITESDELEKPAEELEDNSSCQVDHDLNVSVSVEVSQVNETSNICETTAKEIVEELNEWQTFYQGDDSPSGNMMTEDYTTFQASTSFIHGSGNNQEGENEQQPEHTFNVEYDNQFQEQNVYNVSNDVEVNAVPETFDGNGMAGKESADENIESPTFQLEYNVPPAAIVTNDYEKPNENYFEYDPFMNSHSFEPEIILESDKIGQCQNQAEQNILDESFNGQFQENANFGGPNETEYAETLDSYEIRAGESNEENTESQIFHLGFQTNGAKPTESYFDYDPYQTSEDFKQETIVENDPIEYVMGVSDNTQFQQQNGFNMPNDIEDSSLKESTNAFEINERKSLDHQKMDTPFYHVEYEPTDLPKDPIEQYFDYNPYPFESESIVENNPVNYVCENIQFEDNSNIANSPEGSVIDNLSAYKVTDEESYENNVETLVYEHVANREDFVPNDSLPSRQPYYQYDPFHSSVNFTQEILVECVRKENQQEHSLDLSQNNIQDHFDYIDSSDRENSQAGNVGFYSTGNVANEVQKFNYEPETDSHQTNLVTSDSQKSFEQYSEYDPFRSSINLGPEIFVEIYQTGGCQNETEKDTQFQHNELNLSNGTENPINVEISDISQEIEQIPMEENKENVYNEQLGMVNDHKNENYCHMECEYENTIVEQKDTSNTSRLNTENVNSFEIVETPTFNNEECKESFSPTNNKAIHENAGEDPKNNDSNKSESDFSWDFGSQDKTEEVDQLKTDHDDVKEEIDSNAVPDEIVKEESQNTVVFEPDACAANVSDDGDSQIPKQTENLDTESHLDSADICEVPNEQNTTEEPPQNEETQKTRKKRNRKKKGKRADEEDNRKPEEEPLVEGKVENEVDEQKEQPKETPEIVDQEANKTEEQVVTTNKRNRRKKKQNNQEEPPQVESKPVEEIPQVEVANTVPLEQTPEQENTQGTEQEAKKRRNRRKRR